MGKYIATVLIAALLSTAQLGCSRGFWGGAAVGTVGTGAAYEYSNKKQMDRLEEDFKAGRIDKEEYFRRKKQIQDGSIIY